MQRGVLMFAFNNPEIDYFNLAVMNATQIKHHMGEDIGVAVVCDQVTRDYYAENHDDKFVHNIDHIIIKEKDKEFKHRNIRSYRDTKHNVQRLNFYNVGRTEAYELTPFEETIMIDVDLLVLGDSLNLCWDDVNPVMINHSYEDPCQDRVFEDVQRLHGLGIDMYWATQVYFRKSPEAQTFFFLCDYVKQNYQYFKSVYNWPWNLYRNDYVFSVAAHMYTGFTGEHMPEMPVKLFNTFDYDDVHSVTSTDRVVMYLEKPRTDGDFMISDWQHNNLHIMNKWALGRISEDLMRLHSE